MEIDKTPHRTKRLILYKDEVPEDQVRKDALFTALDVFSIWGGQDGNHEEYYTWEFGERMSESEIEAACRNSGCILRGVDELPF